MKKIYISPVTDVYKFISRDGILNEMSNKYGSSTFDPGDDWGQSGESSSEIGKKDPGDEIGNVDYSRNSNGGNVWDNAW